MNKFSINRVLRVAAIYFKDSKEPLRDRIIYVAGNFLVVAQGEDDIFPTWYNVDLIDRLEGVEMKPEPPRKQRITFV